MKRKRATQVRRARRQRRVPPDLQLMFAAERRRAPAAEAAAADGVEDRLWSRVAVTVGLFPGGGGGGGGGAPAAGSGASGLAEIDAGARLSSASMAGSASGGGLLGSTLAKLLVAAALLGAGAFGGAALERARGDGSGDTRAAVDGRGGADLPEPDPRDTARAAAAASVRADATSDATSATDDLAPVVIDLDDAVAAPTQRADGPQPSSAPSARGSSTASPGPSASASPSASARGGDADLAAERALLEKARGALGRGDTGSAFAALSDHATRFPRARLGEEREALWIQGLAASGRTEEARARLARLRQRSPGSLMVPALEAMLGG